MNPSTWSIETPHPRNLPVFWDEADRSERSPEQYVIYSATVSNERWQLRMNDFPAEPLYTLFIDGMEIESFDEFPAVWSRPDESARKLVPAAIPNDPVRQVRERAYAKWERAWRPPGDGVGDWLAAEAELRYLRAVATLPLPTAAQIAAFADHVAGAHSWYKQLGSPEPLRLVAFLDPDAGMQRGTTGGIEGVVPLVTRDDCWHYSLMPTAEYRRKLGHWSYWVVGSRGDPDLTIREPDGTRIPVPAEVWERSGCPACALLGAPTLSIPRAFEAGRRWFAAERADRDAVCDSLAKAVLTALLAADLIAVRDHEAAVAGIAECLMANPEDRPAAVVQFLNRSDHIDEIYATDAELRAVVAEALFGTGG